VTPWPEPANLERCREGGTQPERIIVRAHGDPGTHLDASLRAWNRARRAPRHASALVRRAPRSPGHAEPGHALGERSPRLPGHAEGNQERFQAWTRPMMTGGKTGRRAGAEFPHSARVSTLAQSDLDMHATQRSNRLMRSSWQVISLNSLSLNDLRRRRRRMPGHAQGPPARPASASGWGEGRASPPAQPPTRGSSPPRTTAIFSAPIFFSVFLVDIRVRPCDNPQRLKSSNRIESQHWEELPYGRETEKDCYI
jgi:hypothetical protein